MVPLDRSRMDRFHRVAPETLRRRDRAFYQREFSLGLELVLTGVFTIVGAVAFGWPPINWLLFLVLGVYTGILTDCIKLWFLREPIHRYADDSADDQFVSAVCQALREGNEEIPAPQDGGRYRPGRGLFFDLVFAPVSTVMIVAILKEEGFTGWTELFDQKYFVPAVVLFFAWQVVQATWQIVAFRRGGAESGPVKVLLGGRGAGLFVLFFLILMAGSCTGKEGDFTLAFYLVNGLLILFGFLNTFGLILIRNETRWLREYLEGRK